MRRRFATRALFASLLLGLLAVHVQADIAPGVKVIRGPELVAPGDEAIDAAARQRRTAAPERLAAAPKSTRSTSRAEAPKDPWSLASFGAHDSLIDEASWGAESATTDGTSCGNEGCDCGACDSSCGGSCVPCCRPYGLAAAVEATYLRPTISNNRSDFDSIANFGYQAAPRLWVQWQAMSGWGVRGRYWNLDAQWQQTGTFNEPDTVGAQTSSENLNVYAVDLELTRSFISGRTWYCASLGARHGRLHHNQNLDLTVFDLSGGGGDDASAILIQADRDFNGTGITGALGIQRPLFDSRLALFCNLRGSVLWGGNDLRASATVIEVVPVGVGDLNLNDFTTIGGFGSNGNGMWIGEVQAGGQWNTPISNAVGAGNAFIRVMFEGQWWNLPGVTATDDFSTRSQYYNFLGVTAAIGYLR